MKLEGRSTVPTSRQSLWDLLLDVERIAKCFPGAENVAPAGADAYSGTLKIKVGPVSLGLSGTLTVREMDREAWQALLHVEGSDRRVGGGVRGDVTLRLTELNQAETELTVISDISFMGKLGELGQPIIRRKADTTMQEFARNLAQEASGT